VDGPTAIAIPVPEVTGAVAQILSRNCARSGSTFWLTWAILVLVVMGLGGCTTAWHEPTPNHGARWQNVAWRIHCETALTHQEFTEDMPAADQSKWVFARDSNGVEYQFEGRLVDGFLEVSVLRNPDSTTFEPARLAVRKLCLDEIGRVESDKELMLGWVMAARPSEKVNVPPVYRSEDNQEGKVTRVVIFGDSLSDTGRLKQRLRVFPARPYWIGRFSNGPVWPEYLAMATGMAAQNHSYGGASAAVHDALPGANMYARIRDAGQLFVSGTIDLQIEDYISRTLADGRIERADTTAFLIWSGANDYISREPVTGLIGTFLNSPEGVSGYKTVVERAVEKTREQVHTLYDAGARRFVILDLPDLGRTPIVLQNTTYTPEYEVEDANARRLELAKRLQQLTRYHNDMLEKAIKSLRVELMHAEVIQVNTFEYFEALNGVESGAEVSAQKYGFDLLALQETIRYADSAMTLPQGCYTGSYLGSNDANKICAQPGKAVFWDVVHPTTLTHCWQAWRVGMEIANAGWTEPLPEPAIYLDWCQAVVKRVTSRTTGHFVPFPKNTDL
jgi:thermolabile hemolysin